MIEVLKQALEALELVSTEFVCDGAHHAKKDRHGLGEPCPIVELYEETIASLRQAIAELESQEPVAWITPDGEGFRIRFSPPTNDVPLGWDALYTHPPQRTEQNFCPRCGKRTNDIHTCTPPQQAQKQEPIKIDGNTSDGYHTFNELYEFRKAYNVALFNEWASGGKCSVHKSWRHHDGKLCFGGGWFIVVAVLPQGQISNHYEAKDWNLFAIPEVERALFEFDGHTGNDVIERLEAYTTPQPQRTWVGLTDEEISQLWLCTSPYFHDFDFARAIEAKLKELNT
jgi:hypothetical protein